MAGANRIALKNLNLFRQEAFIGGSWKTANGGKCYGIKNPADESVIATVPDMTVAETNDAIAAATKAFDKWKNTTGRERAGVLLNWFNLMKENNEELAQILTAEAGKPLAESRGEVSYGASFIEWFGEEAKRIQGEIPTSPSTNKEMMFIRQPIGVVGMITPWNFPNAMIARKASAAMAAGCTCVVRPAEDTPLSALAIAALAQKAGVPEGVFNVITSSRDNAASIGKLLCTHDDVAGISFTGSTAVGKILYNQCSSGVKRLGLELGGNAPFIVFDSANVEKAIEGLMVAKFRNSGQTCVSANRILIQSGIYDQFTTALKKTLLEKLKVGNGMSEGVTIGPLINHAQLNKVDGIVNRSIESGATCVLGGRRHELGGQFYEPTLLLDCDTKMPCFQEEVFGPVVPIMKFNSEQDAVHIANDTNRGLAAYFYSGDISQVFRVSKQLEAGMIGVNEGLISCAEAAFGGIKESGIGREGSRHGLDDYTYVKYICIGGIQN